MKGFSFKTVFTLGCTDLFVARFVLSDQRENQADQSHPYIRSRPPIIHGFTLIELLIVIALISLLLALIVPSLRATRQMMQRITCGTNLKALNMSAILYATDNHDRLMVKKIGMNPNQQYLGFQQEILNGLPDLRQMFNGYLDGFDIQTGPSPVMYCPSARPQHDQVRKELSFELCSDRWDQGEYVMGYAYWGADEEEYLDVIGLDWFSEYDPVYRTTTAKSYTPLFSDLLEKHHFSPSPWPWGLASHTKKGTIEFTYDHPSGQNNARLDGSVEFEKFEENQEWEDGPNNSFGELEAATHRFESEDILLLWGGM